MPRDLPVGNGRMLVTFDEHYQLRDLYFPHVGQENHAGEAACRFGVFTDKKLHWSNDGWSIHGRYLRDSLTTSVALEHEDLKVRLYCNDAVDFHRRVFVRKIKIKNLAAGDREIRILHHQALRMLGTNVGDTAYYDPDLKSVVHYRGQRYILATFLDHEGNPALSQYATGTSGFGGAEGTWRDAEDGDLQGNTIAQGAVDSTIAHHAHVPAHGEQTCYMLLICGHSREELLELHAWLHRQTAQGILDRTTAYWRLWVSGAAINFGDLPKPVTTLFKRSLLTVRTQIDDGGAIIAANDSDILQFSRDTYSYMWPRDGALVADAVDAAGFPMLARKFFEFCQRTITPEGYLHHKYNPDGSVASSWHPWMTKEGQRRLPIQEDETALVVWALWRHFERHRDTEFIRPMWVDIVQPAADFMVAYRDEVTKLPHPSHDLWEERWGVHAFTVATVFAALESARKFAEAFGDRVRAARYATACQEIRAAAADHLYSPAHGRFLRRITPTETITGTRETLTGTGTANSAPAVAAEGTSYEPDDVLDASLYAIGHFGLFPASDPRVRATMDAVEKRLWIKTPVGGAARYENDYYHRVSNDIKNVPGNPWFICTLWLADDIIARATTPEELREALPILEWTANHTLESGILAEQVHPHTGAPLSVSPLTWSHAQVVSTSIAYLEKLQSLASCPTCTQPLFQLRGPIHSTRPQTPALETLAATASLAAGSIAIDTPACIGCNACVTACAHQVLVTAHGKALTNLTRLHHCDLDGACATACPTRCLTISKAA